MAGYGPAPKEGAKLGRYTSELEQPTTALAGAAVQPPRLPKPRSLCVETRHWWERWTRSPMAETFCETDWSRLLMLMPLVEAYNRMTDVDNIGGDDWSPSGAAKLLAEIRMSESLLGATHLDRLRGRIKIERSEKPPAAEETPEGVAILDHFRKAVAG